ncbi:15272_t:CDS:1, partial [Rhizophagus irregularis]
KLPSPSHANIYPPFSININSSQPTIIIMPGTNLDNQNQLQQILNHFSSTSNSQRRL